MLPLKCEKCGGKFETRASIVARMYDDNITLIGPLLADPHVKLAANEYFALMVEDMPRDRHDDRHFFDRYEGWLGLECTTGVALKTIVYISKKFGARCVPERGSTWLVRVKDASRCCVLEG